MSILMIPARHYLVAATRWVEKHLPKDFQNLLKEYEECPTILPKATFSSRFSRYSRMYRDFIYGNRLYNCHSAMYHLFRFDQNFDSRLRQINRCIDSYIEAKSTIKAVARAQYLDYLRIHRANIFGPSFPNEQYVLDLKFVTPPIQMAAKDIWLKKDWKDLPILADMCEDSGCQEQPILEYLRNTILHKDLRIHCWALQLMITVKADLETITHDYSFTNATRIERW